MLVPKSVWHLTLHDVRFSPLYFWGFLFFYSNTCVAGRRIISDVSDKPSAFESFCTANPTIQCVTATYLNPNFILFLVPPTRVFRYESLKLWVLLESVEWYSICILLYELCDLVGATGKQALLLVVDSYVANLCHSQQCQLVSRLHSLYPIDKEQWEGDNKILAVGWKVVAEANEVNQIDNTLKFK